MLLSPNASHNSLRINLLENGRICFSDCELFGKNSAHVWMAVDSGSKEHPNPIFTRNLCFQSFFVIETADATRT